MHAVLLVTVTMSVNTFCDILQINVSDSKIIAYFIIKKYIKTGKKLL